MLRRYALFLLVGMFLVTPKNARAQTVVSFLNYDGDNLTGYSAIGNSPYSEEEECPIAAVDAGGIEFCAAALVYEPWVSIDAYLNGNYVGADLEAYDAQVNSAVSHPAAGTYDATGTSYAGESQYEIDCDDYADCGAPNYEGWAESGGPFDSDSGPYSVVVVTQQNLTETAAGANLVVGDQYTISISSPFPNAGISQGALTNFAFTDASGNWSATETAANPGKYVEVFTVNGVSTPPLAFFVLGSHPTVVQTDLTYPAASPSMFIGDSFQISVSAGTPAAGQMVTTIDAQGNFNDGYTDSNGNLLLHGTGRNVGSFTETFYVGGVSAAPVLVFNVNTSGTQFQTSPPTNDAPPDVAAVPTPPPPVSNSAQICNDISGPWILPTIDDAGNSESLLLSENSSSVTGTGTSGNFTCGYVTWQITGTDNGSGNFSLNDSNPSVAADLCGRKPLLESFSMQVNSNSCSSAVVTTQSVTPSGFVAHVQGLSNTWTRTSSPPGVNVTVDLMAGKITTQLSGQQKTSNLILAVNNSQGQQLLPIPHNSAQSGTSFSDSFRTQLPPGQQIGSVTATWDTTNVSVPVSFYTIGLTHFTQYNTPYHSQCSANPQPSLIIYQIDKKANGYCYYQDAMLGAIFISQVGVNGTGVLDMNGTNTVLKAYSAGAQNVCSLYPGTNAAHTFFSVDVAGNPITTVTGSNNKVLVDGTNTPSAVNNNNPPPGSLATDPSATTKSGPSLYQYSDSVLIFDQNDSNDARGLRSVQDLCPKCRGQGTQQGTSPAHIDMYNGVTKSCDPAVVGDYGQFYAIRAR